jgi:hypothetical protein
MTLVIELPPELEHRLEEAASRKGQSVGDFARAVLEHRLGKENGAVPSPDGPPAPPIWQIAAESMQGVPEEELRRLPVDLSENLDHFLYGAPKR